MTGRVWQVGYDEATAATVMQTVGGTFGYRPNGYPGLLGGASLPGNTTATASFDDVSVFIPPTSGTTFLQAFSLHLNSGKTEEFTPIEPSRKPSHNDSGQRIASNAPKGHTWRFSRKRTVVTQGERHHQKAHDLAIKVLPQQPDHAAGALAQRRHVLRPL